MNSNPLDSFKVRPAALDDAVAITQLVNACSMERTGEPGTTAQRVHGMMQMPGLNLRRIPYLPLIAMSES